MATTNNNRTKELNKIHKQILPENLEKVNEIDPVMFVSELLRFVKLKEK